MRTGLGLKERAGSDSDSEMDGEDMMSHFLRKIQKRDQQ